MLRDISALLRRTVRAYDILVRWGGEEFLIVLPGVDLEEVETAIEGAYLVVAGARTLPAELATAVIHRLELPQGRFERRIRLPGGRYGAVRRAAVHGCVLITLQKA